MKTFSKSKRRTARAVRAFTLVEVVLALGVVSFAMISMLGLLTAGLETFHYAINATTEAEIAQQLANQLELASYANLTTNGASTNYFTQEGLLTNSTSAVYTATVSPAAKLTVPGGMASYPTNTLTFIISIWSKSSPQVTNATPIQIANNGS